MTTHTYKCRFTDDTSWRTVTLDDLSMSCECDGTLQEWLEAARTDITGRDETLIAYRTINASPALIGTRRLRLVALHRCYGGLEEGGWWYDAPETLREWHVPAASYERHRARLDRFAAAYNSTRRINDEPKWIVTSLAERPHKRPHYC